MDNIELEQLDTLLTKLIQYFKEINKKNSEFVLDNMESIEKYQKFIQSIPLDKIKSIDEKVVEYFDEYTIFLEKQKYF